MHQIIVAVIGSVFGGAVTAFYGYKGKQVSTKTDLDKSYPDAISTLNQQVTQLTEERAKYAGQSIKLQRKVDDLQDTVHDQDKIIKEQTQIINTLRDQVHKQSELIDKLNRQIGDMSKKLDRLGNLEEEEIKNDENN